MLLRLHIIIILRSLFIYECGAAFLSCNSYLSRNPGGCDDELGTYIHCCDSALTRNFVHCIGEYDPAHELFTWDWVVNNCGDGYYCRGSNNIGERGECVLLEVDEKPITKVSNLPKEYKLTFSRVAQNGKALHVQTLGYKNAAILSVDF